jgi:hypothetical protein
MATVMWFNSIVDTDPTTLGNYWLDRDCTIPATELPNWDVDIVIVLGTFVGDYIGRSAGRDVGANKGAITGNCTFYNGSMNQGAIVGNAVFYDTSANDGDISGTVRFENTSRCLSGVIGGLATFTQSSAIQQILTVTMVQFNGGITIDLSDDYIDPTPANVKAGFSYKFNGEDKQGELPTGLASGATGTFTLTFTV